MTNDLAAAGIEYSFESGLTTGWHSDTPGTTWGVDTASAVGTRALKFSFTQAGTGYWYVFPEDRSVPAGGRRFSAWLKASAPMSVQVIVHHGDYAEHYEHTF